MLGGDGKAAGTQNAQKGEEIERMTQVPHPEGGSEEPGWGWAHRIAAYLHRLGGERLDNWLMPSYSSLIYQHVRDGDLPEALELLEEMKAEGETPSHAVYEMLIRGCTIAMRRVGQGEVPGAIVDGLPLNPHDLEGATPLDGPRAHHRQWH